MSREINFRPGDIVVRDSFPASNQPEGRISEVVVVMPDPGGLRLALKFDKAKNRTAAFYRMATADEVLAFHRGIRDVGDIILLDQFATKEKLPINDKKQKNAGNTIDITPITPTISSGSKPRGNSITGGGRRIAIEIGHLSNKAIFG